MSRKKSGELYCLSGRIVIEENYRLGQALFTFGKPTLSPFMFFFFDFVFLSLFPTQQHISRSVVACRLACCHFLRKFARFSNMKYKILMWILWVYTFIGKGLLTIRFPDYFILSAFLKFQCCLLNLTSLQHDSRKLFIINQ